MAFENLPFALKKYGEGDRKCSVEANFACITIEPKSIVYNYNIDISMVDSFEESNKKRPCTQKQQDKKIKERKKIINSLNFKILQKLYEEDKKSRNPIFPGEPVFDGKKKLLHKRAT